MEDNKDDKYKTVKIISHINEILTQTEITQFYKNTSKSPIELLIEISELTNSNITKFEMTLDEKKIIQKSLKRKKEKKNIIIQFLQVIMASFLLMKIRRILYA